MQRPHTPNSVTGPREESWKQVQGRSGERRIGLLRAVETSPMHAPFKQILRMRSTADHALPSLMSAIDAVDCADTKLPVQDEEREMLEPAPGTFSVAAERVVPVAEGGMKP